MRCRIGKRAAAGWAMAILVLTCLSTGHAQVPDDAVDAVRADLAVTAVEIVGTPPGSCAAPPAQPGCPRFVHQSAGPVEVRATITNLGGPAVAGYVVAFAWKGAQQTVPLAGEDPESSRDVVLATLNRGETDTYDMEWTPRWDQRGPGAIVVSLTPLGADADPGNNVLERPLHVVHHELEVSFDPGDRLIRAGEIIFLRFHVENRGNVAETVSLRRGSATGPVERLDIRLERPVLVVPPSAAREVRVLVGYPFDFDPSPFAVTFEVEALSSYGVVYAGPSPQVASTQDPPPAGFGFSAMLKNGPVLYAEPGGQVETTVSITNTGQLDDALRVITDSAWEAWLADPLVGLVAGETRDVPITVEVPSTAAPGESKAVHVTVESTHAAGVDLLLTVRASGPAVGLASASIASPAIYAGDLLELRVSLTNEGDEASPAGTLAAAVPGTPLSATVGVPSLKPRESRTVAVPVGSITRPGGFEVDVDLQPPSPSAASQATVVGWVRAPGLALLPPAGQEGLPGEAVQYAQEASGVQVRNTGNSREVFAVGITTSAGRAVPLDPRPLALEPGASRTIAFTHDLPKHAVAAVPVDVELWILERPDLRWTTRVSTTPVAPPPPTVSLDPLPARWPAGQDLAFDVEVDTLSVAESVTLHVKDPNGSVRVQPILFNGTGTARITFAATGQHVVWAQAVDAFGTVGKSIETSLVVHEELVAPAIGWTTQVPDKLTAGTVLALGAADPASVSVVRLTVHDDAGDVARNETLERHGGGWAFNLSALEPGSYSIRVVAENAQGVGASLWANVTLTDPAEGHPHSMDNEKRMPLLPPAASLFALLLAAGRAGRAARRPARGDPEPSRECGQPMTRSAFTSRRIGCFVVLWVRSMLGAAAAAAGRLPRRRLLASVLIIQLVLGILAGATWAGSNPSADALSPRSGHAVSPHEAYVETVEQMGLHAEDLPPGLQMAFDPSFAPPAPPGSLAGILASLPGIAGPGLPIPEPPRDPHPLLPALAGYATALGVPLPPQHDLLAQVRSLGLDASGEAALAQLILAYTQATLLQRDATALLDPEEMAFVTLDPPTIESWLAQDPERTMADVEARATQITGKIDMVKTWQAADLLARTVEHVRGPLADSAALVPARSPAWSTMAHLLGPAPAASATPTPGLGPALTALAAAYGVNAGAVDATALHGLPDEVQHAIADIVVAKAASSLPAPEQARLLLDAIESALPVLQEWARSDGLQAPASAPASVWPSTSACVPSDLDQPPRVPDVAVPDPNGVLPTHDVLLDVPFPAFAPDCRPNPPLLLITGLEGTAHDRPAIIRIDLGGNDIYLTEVAGPGNVTMTGGSPESNLPVAINRSLGSIHIDVGGHDVYDTPDASHTQGSAIGGASLLVDAAGNDIYRAGQFSQGATCCKPPPLPPVSTEGSLDGLGPGGVGLLLDLAGSDVYEGGARSQGYAEFGLDRLTMAEVSSGFDFLNPQVTPANRQEAGFMGLLVDAAGRDEYTFSTQGFARQFTSDARYWRIGAQVGDGGATTKTLAAVVDLADVDTYRSTGIQVDTNDPDAIFTTQGISESRAPYWPAGSSDREAALAVGVFLDSEGIDDYWMEDFVDGMQQVDKNSPNPVERVRFSTAAGEPAMWSKSVSAFLDVDPLVDTDGDLAPDLLEAVLGTDPDDATSSPSSLPRGPEALDGGQDLLRVPRPGASVGVLALPGMVIGSPADSVHGLANIFFLVDLGGEDRYTGAGIGGMGAFQAPGIPDSRDPLRAQPVSTRVALLLDVGGEDDVYEPAPVLVDERGGGQIPAPFVRPSLGGALMGVALSADDGGRNHYNSSYVRYVQRNVGAVNRGDEYAMGLNQGAGAWGGIGMLATWNATNTFESTTFLRNEAIGCTTCLPEVWVRGVSQGGAWNGVGVLANLGQGDDVYHASVNGTTNRLGGGEYAGVSNLGAVQGASQGGMAVVVDAGGNDRFVADAPLAQGASAGAMAGHQSGTNYFSVPGATEYLGITNPVLPGLGLLWAGGGDDEYQAVGLSQGAAIQLQALVDDMAGRPGFSYTNDAAFSLPGASPLLQASQSHAFGILLDAAGNDAYTAAATAIPMLGRWNHLAQGAGAAGGTGLLVDGFGDDVYDARGVQMVQGAGVLGQGMLLDLAGNDAYQATRKAQGHASDAARDLAFAGQCLGNVNNLQADFLCGYWGFPFQSPDFPPRPGYRQGTFQAVAQVQDRMPSTGVLVDRGGTDRYEAQDWSQGDAAVASLYIAAAGACRHHQLQLQAYLIVTLFPAYRSCDPRFTGDFSGWGQNVQHPWTEQDTSAGPPSDPPVIALLVDGEGEDGYSYGTPQLKSPVASGSSAPSHGNNWEWTQTRIPSRQLNETRLPEELSDEDVQQGDGEAEGSQMGYTAVLIPTWASLAGSVVDDYDNDTYTTGIAQQQIILQLLIKELTAENALVFLSDFDPYVDAPLLDFDVEPITFSIEDSGVVFRPGRHHFGGGTATLAIEEGFEIPVAGVPVDPRAVSVDQVRGGDVTIDLGEFTLDHTGATTKDVRFRFDEWGASAPAGGSADPDQQDGEWPAVAGQHLQELELLFDLPLCDAVAAGTDASCSQSFRRLGFIPALRVQVGPFANNATKATLSLAPILVQADASSLEDGSRHLPHMEVPRQTQPAIGLGIDSNTLTEAAQTVLRTLLKGTLQEDAPVAVDVRVFEDGAGTDPLDAAAGEVGNGTLHPFVEVRLPAGDAQRIDRVDVLANGILVGRAELSPEQAEGAPLIYTLPWVTDQLRDDGLLQYRDGSYRVVASVFLAAEGVEPTSIDSPPSIVELDNPPIIHAGFTSPVQLDPTLASSELDPTVPLPAISPTLGHVAALAVKIAPDLAFPPGYSPNGGEEPGGFLNVTLVERGGRQTLHLVDEVYYPSGTHTVDVTGFCKPQVRCHDGLYDVHVTVKDSAAQPRSDDQVLLIDGTAPVSWITNPDHANRREHAKGADTLRVRWEFHDDTLKIGDGNVSGVTRVHLYKIDKGLPVEQGVGKNGASDVKGVKPGGDLVRLVTVAVDRLGNSESACIGHPDPGWQNLLAGAKPCHDGKLQQAAAGLLPEGTEDRWIQVDFKDPEVKATLTDAEIGAVLSTPVHIVPGKTPVEFIADVTDEGSGLRHVLVRFDDAGSHSMAPREPGKPSYSFGAWHESNDALGGGRERWIRYEVVAQDIAGNQRGRESRIFVDDLPPRVTVLEVAYPDSDGNLLPAGRKNGKAEIQVRVSDGALETVLADFTRVTGVEHVDPCFDDPTTPDPLDWICPYAIGSVDDGDHPVTIRALDKAGNVNDTQQAILRVSNAPVAIGDLRVVTTDHESATVAWSTDQPATSQVFFRAKTSDDVREKGLSTPLHTGLTDEHTVRVTGLNPSTLYFMQASSRNPGGVENTSIVIPVRTTTAINITAPALRAGDILGEGSVLLDVRFRSGSLPADIEVFLQDASKHASPIPVGRVGGAAGLVEVPINRSAFADGAYIIVVAAQRLSDFATYESPPILLDNTPPTLVPLSPLPGDGVAATDPLFEFLVLDPLADHLPPLDSMRVAVDGVVYEAPGGSQAGQASSFAPAASRQLAQAAYVPGAGGSATLRFRLGDVLAEGDHAVSVSLTDRAGNVGTGTVGFRTDPAASTEVEVLDILYEPGPTAAQPGSNVTLSLQTGHAAARVHASSPGLMWDSALQPAEGGWAARLQVPPGTASGTHDVQVVAEDAAGAEVLNTAVPIIVDGQAPQLGVAVLPTKVSAGFTITADEPVRVHLSTAGREATAPGASRHEIVFGPLRPGIVHQAVLVATDGAGNEARSTHTFQTADDTAPPGPVAALRAVATAAGINVSWEPASDDAGISHYRVGRMVGDGEPQWTPTPNTHLVDVPPAGAVNLTYLVEAVDVVGKVGAQRSAHVMTDLPPPHLSAISVTPAEGDERTVFTFAVTYWHPVPVESIRLSMSGLEFAMTPAGDADHCTDGCRYQTSTNLPATSLATMSQTLRVSLEAFGHEVDAEAPAPRVRSESRLALEEDDAQTPAAALLPFILALLGLAAFQRRNNP